MHCGQWWHSPVCHLCKAQCLKEGIWHCWSGLLKQCLLKLHSNARLHFSHNITELLDSRHCEHVSPSTMQPWLAPLVFHKFGKLKNFSEVDKFLSDIIKTVIVEWLWELALTGAWMSLVTAKSGRHHLISHPRREWHYGCTHDSTVQFLICLGLCILA